MAHRFAHNWKSFTLIKTPQGNVIVQPDGEMDLTSMDESGKLTNGNHGGKKLTGQATGDTLVLDEDTSDYSGKVVHEQGQTLAIAGKKHFKRVDQDDPPWIIIK